LLSKQSFWHDRAASTGRTKGLFFFFSTLDTNQVLESALLGPAGGRTRFYVVAVVAGSVEAGPVDKVEDEEEEGEKKKEEDVQAGVSLVLLSIGRIKSIAHSWTKQRNRGLGNLTKISPKMYQERIEENDVSLFLRMLYMWVKNL
jgi:hypothetical protein